MMYSTPRKRHRKRSDKQRNESREAVKVPWGFVIAQADVSLRITIWLIRESRLLGILIQFNDGTLCVRRLQARLLNMD